MRKILIVANREYQSAVRTKTFLLGLLIMPVMMGGSAVLQYLLRDVVDVDTKSFVIVDRAGREDLVVALEEAVKKHNVDVFDAETKVQMKPKFHAPRFEKPSADKIAEERLELSKRARDGNIVGFLEILPPDPTGLKPQAAVILRYQSNNATYGEFAAFAQKEIGKKLREQFASAKGLSHAETQTLLDPAHLENKGLATRDAEGNIQDASEQSRFGSLIVPSLLMVLMFMLVLMGSTPLMQGVVEEKMQRIAEVLLGSVRPFELMLGKLIGMTGVSLTIGGVYLIGAYWAINNFGIGESLTVPLILWFLLFQILASLMFGSLFIAVGAACTEMKETQNLVLPIMILACIPMFVMGSLLREPNGPVIRALTFFPFATPALMVARLAIVPNVAWWEPVLGIGIVLATTLLCVWIAGRIFRVGILLQGKGAGIGQILRWILRG